MKLKDEKYQCERCGEIFEAKDMDNRCNYAFCNRCAYEYEAELAQCMEEGLSGY